MSTERDQAIDQLIGVIGEVDAILQAQSEADSEYFLKVWERSLGDDEIKRIKSGFLKAYRWQHIFSGVEHPRFKALFEGLTTEDHRQRVSETTAPHDLPGCPLCTAQGSMAFA